MRSAAPIPADDGWRRRPEVAAATAPSGPRASWSTEEGAAPLPEVAVVWRFGAGSPTPGVALAPDGTVYVPTNEGHVHALSTEGRLLWAYNVHTPAVGAVVAGNGVVVVGTQEGKLVALRPNGTGLWTFRVPFPIVTELLLDTHGRVVFGDGAGYVSAVDGFGAVRFRTAAGGMPAGAMVALADGGLAVATTNGELVWLGAGRRRSLDLGGRVERGVEAIAGPRIAVMVAGQLCVVRDGAVILRLPNVIAAALHDSGLVTVSAEGGLAYRALDGTVELERTLPAMPSAAPVVDARQTVYVPTAAGTLLIVSRGSQGVRTVHVGDGALTRPLLDPCRGRVVAASGAGTVVAFRMPIGS